MRHYDGLPLRPPVNPGACKANERFVVIAETPKGFQLVETHKSESRAYVACETLNRHERINNRRAVYCWADCPGTPTT